MSSTKDTAPPGGAHIPIHNRAGELVAYALVDAEDHAWVSRLKWHLHGGPADQRYVSTGSRPCLYLHRLVMGLPPIAQDPREVDHINRDRLDNRRANLRLTSRAENAQNVPAKGRSRFRGVHWEAGRERWRAEVSLNGRRVYRERFDTELEAAVAAERARAAHLPFAEPDPALRGQS